MILRNNRWGEKEYKFADEFFRKIKDKDPFAFSRWGDGEWLNVAYALVHKYANGLGISVPETDNGNKDGCTYYTNLGLRLLDIISQKQYYYMGHQFSLKPMYTLKEHFPQDWVNSDILHNISENQGLDFVYEIFDSVHVVFVGNEELQKLPFVNESVVIPYNNAWVDYDNLLNKIKELITTEHKTFLFAAGMCAEVFIHDLWNFSKSNTYLDIGSAFDPYVNRNTRGYHSSLKLNKKLVVE